MTNFYLIFQIVCQQTFNPHAQFGLSFIRMQSPAEASPGSLGRFQLRDEEEDNFVPGSLFARRKDVPVTSPSKGIYFVVFIQQQTILSFTLYIFSKRRSSNF